MLARLIHIHSICVNCLTCLIFVIDDKWQRYLSQHCWQHWWFQIEQHEMTKESLSLVNIPRTDRLSVFHVIWSATKIMLFLEFFFYFSAWGDSSSHALFFSFFSFFTFSTFCSADSSYIAFFFFFLGTYYYTNNEGEYSDSSYCFCCKLLLTKARRTRGRHFACLVLHVFHVTFFV
jgi:hypothetical protein